MSKFYGVEHAKGGFADALEILQDSPDPSDWCADKILTLALSVVAETRSTESQDDFLRRWQHEREALRAALDELESCGELTYLDAYEKFVFHARRAEYGPRTSDGSCRSDSDGIDELVQRMRGKDVGRTVGEDVDGWLMDMGIEP